MAKIRSIIATILLATLLAVARSSVAPVHSDPSTKPTTVEDLSIESQRLRVEFDHNMRSRLAAKMKGREIALGPFSASETVEGKDRSWYDFRLDSQMHERVTDSIGGGERLTLSGSSGILRKSVAVTIYDDFPNLAVFDVSYTNTGKSPLEIRGWRNNSYTIDAPRNSAPVPFWSFQSASYERRPNWVVPLRAGFHQQNYLGMNASDYGGGTPIVDVWNKEVGVGVGLVEPGPRLISLPVSMPNAHQARVSVQYHRTRSLRPGENFHTFRSFVAVHDGDYFQTLLSYRGYMSKLGFHMASAPEEAFGAIWCAWGYGRNFKPQQVYDTLPTVKRMGFTWVTLDDGWQNNYGDW